MDDTYTQFASRAAEIQKVADEVSDRFFNLATFQDALRWNSDTRALIRLLEQFNLDITEYCTKQEGFLNLAETTRSTQSFLKRTFGIRREENQYKENIESANTTIASVETAVSGLNDLIDRTPTSKAEQKNMLQELRQLKKELTTEKREINETTRQIRTKARQDMTKMTGIHGRGVMGSMARYQRVHIRDQKESSLKPHEIAKANIEMQIIEVEKRINWTSRFTGDDPQPQAAALRCAYCGRRVEPNRVCPGCGSDQTIIVL